MNIKEDHIFIQLRNMNKNDGHMLGIKRPQKKLNDIYNSWYLRIFVKL